MAEGLTCDILLILKDRLPLIAPIQQMVEGPGKKETRRVCHAFPPTQTA
jgi:hypothetical protein